jgi:hypothetical protein
MADLQRKAGSSLDLVDKPPVERIVVTGRAALILLALIVSKPKELNRSGHGGEEGT